MAVLEGAVTLQFEDVKGAAWAGGVTRTVPIIEDKRLVDQGYLLNFFIDFNLMVTYIVSQDAVRIGAPPCWTHSAALLF